MPTIFQTPTFLKWFDGLRDERAQARIVAGICRLELGNAGDVKSVGDGVLEMRIDCGPGYRVYFVHRGEEIVILLCGGDKSRQDRDILTAKDLARKE